MTLEFKFPEDQTNLLALDGTIYKIKLSYEADCAAQNQALSVGACTEVVKRELEEAFRAIVLMFINDQPLRPVTTRHFKFYTNSKPWRASRKLKFRYNGDDLETSENFLDINVWTMQIVSPGLRDFANCSTVCSDLSPHLSAQDHSRFAQDTLVINIPTRSGRQNTSSHVFADGTATKRKVEIRRSNIRGSPSKKKRVNTVRKKRSTNSRSPKKKKKFQKKKKSISRRKSSKTKKKSFDWNFNNVVGKWNQGSSDNRTLAKRLVTRSQLRSTASSEKETPSTSTAMEMKSQNVPSYRGTKIVQTIPSPNQNTNQLNDTNLVTDGIARQPETKLSSPPAKTRKRTLLRKAQLDQFVVQEEELAEERKLQQLAQPIRSSPRKIPGNKTKAPALRLSLGSTLNMILTPFKILTRSMNNRQ